MPCLTTCCCGFSVRAGTRAIAILSLVYSVLGLLMVGTYNFGLDRQRLYERQMHGWPSNSNPSFHGVVDTRVINVGQGDFSLPVPPAVDAPVLEVEDIKDDDDDDLDENEPGYDEDLKAAEKKRRLELVMSVYSVAVSVNIIVSLSLLFGVKLEKRWLLMPWVAWNTLSLIVSQMAIFVVPNKSPIIPDIFSTGLSIYCIMCVYSYFQVLSESPARQTQSTWTGAPSATPYFPSPPSLSPRPPLTVELPPDSPPAYQPPDSPPKYDPPPPYPGSPADKNTEFVPIEEAEKCEAVALPENSGNDNINKHIP